MAEYNGAATLVTPGPDILFNRPADPFFHDPTVCTGLEQAPMRSVTENRARTHGAIVYPRLYEGRPIVLGGWVHTTGLAARELALANLEAALDSIMGGVDGTYSWAVQGGTASIDVICDIGVTAPGPWIKKYLFTLMAPDPTITIT